MRWITHPGRALIVALLLAMMPGITGAQSVGTPAASPAAPTQAVWERLEGVQRAVMRTWGDVPTGTPAPGEVPVLRFMSGLVAQFDSAEQASAAVAPIEDWMLASLQVNLVGAEVETGEAGTDDLGDSASAVTASGTVGTTPLSIAVVVVQQDDRVLAVGGNVRAEQELLPLARDIMQVMLDREPGGEEQRDTSGRFTGGLWDIFPEQDDEVLNGMRRQGDVPIYLSPAATPAG